MPVNTSAKVFPLTRFPFKISRESELLPGVCVTKKFNDLFDFNFTPLLNRLKQDFQHRVLLPLSLAGHRNYVKMNIRSRFLYLSQRVPIFIPKSFFFINLTMLPPGLFGTIRTIRCESRYYKNPKALVICPCPNLLGSQFPLDVILDQS